MFLDATNLIAENPPRLHYGVAVTDLDRDGAFEFFIAGYGFPNRLLKWDPEAGDSGALIDVTPPALVDATRQSIGVAAGDLDGDGQEELYVLNTDTFAGEKNFGDRLYDWRDGEWIDLFSVPESMPAANMTAGRSVAWCDRKGTGRYGAMVANYGGPMRFYELGQKRRRLIEMGEKAGLGIITGGRSLLSLPLVSPIDSGRMDIFAGNENGPNLLFENGGDGTFTDIGREAGIDDPLQHVRGAAVMDSGNGERFDLLYANWEGPHRLFRQIKAGRFELAPPRDFEIPTRARTLIVADFDNDGYEEIFLNNMGQSNRLLRRDEAGKWHGVECGDAEERGGLGTGAAVADIDGDGRLELLIAHGEMAAQPLGLYWAPANDNNWVRILPLTKAGAPARGAVVRLTAGGRTQLRAIDAGSGYLCQMEPVAHFGLGAVDSIDSVEIFWPGGASIQKDNITICESHTIEFPDNS